MSIIKISDKSYELQLVHTKLFKKGDNFEKKIAEELFQVPKKNKKWFVVVSEKIIAISQGRSYFLWDIHPGFWARILSNYVKKTPSGIGIGSPWTMQLAIDEVGLGKILLASIAAILTKPFGFEGIFYHIAGRQVSAIDGPTEYSLFPSNVSAKLAPRDPQLAAQSIKDEISKKLKGAEANNFQGVAIIDANDLGQNVLANITAFGNSLIEEIFSGNPMGQGKEQTPLALVYL